MMISCENVARHLLPIYRCLVAKALITKHGLTQKDAAKKLGTTQAAISHYINCKRGVKGIPNYADIESTIEEAASKVANRMATEDVSPEGFNKAFCDLCMELRKTKKCV